jgi:hypothetical protein
VQAPATPYSLADLAQAADRKDPFIAGALSFVIPGLGSFYAGNQPHGWRHLLIHVGTYVVMLVSVNDCINDISVGNACSSHTGLWTVGALGLLANWVWGIFTAVGDAKAANGEQ